MAVVTLDEAKAHLNVTDAIDDAELAAFIDRAEAAIAAKCGPLEPTSKTARVRGGWSALALPVTPVLSLTSITPLGGTALTVADYIVSPGGIVEPVAGGWFGERWYTVVYETGRDAVPADLKLGVLEMVRHLWGTQRGNSPSGALPDEDSGFVSPDVSPGAFTRRVDQLIQPHRQVAI